YDYSINWPSMTSETRTAKKPPKWDYMKNWNRYKLYKTYAALIELKTTYPLFRTSNYEMHTSAYDKRIRLWDDGYVGADFSAVVVGNFNVEETAVYPEFSTATTWYDYFSGDSLVIEQSQTAGNGYNITYQPGEWHIFTDKKLPLPDMTIPIDTSSEGISEYVDNYSLHASVYPNPTVGIVNIDFDSPYGEKIKVMVYSATGEPVRELFPQISAGNRSTLVWDGNNQSGRRVSPGNYFFVINAGKQFDFGWITVVK
ncbi:MAG: T9SS type A sorting domain-containing protein, partial [Bacteroidetes bacterium]|nr:T9SS type A sorting domain-containing protein [Bacteroidota bacterium]